MSPPENAAAPRAALLTIFLTVFIDLVGFSIIFPLFPAMIDFYIAREGSGSLFHGLISALRPLSGEDGKHLPVLFGGILGSLYSTLQFLFAPFWGSLSDRVGRRPVLLITVTGIALSYALWFVSGSFALLIAARLLGGVMSGNISVATAAIADVTTPENRARGMALIGIAFGLGFTLGPAIGAALAGGIPLMTPASEAWGVNPFSGAAAGAFALSALNLLLIARRLKETLPAPERGLRRGHRSANVLKLFGLGDLPGVRRANLIYFIFFLAFSGMEFTLVFLAAERFAFTSRDNAWMFVFVGLLMAFVQGGVVRRLARVFGETKLVLAGLVVVAGGFVYTGLAASPVALYGGLAFLATGSALVTPCLSAIVSLYAPPDRQGEVLGVFRSLGALARAAGPVAAALVYWRFGSESLYLAGAAILMVPLLLGAALPAPLRETDESAPPHPVS